MCISNNARGLRTNFGFVTETKCAKTMFGSTFRTRTVSEHNITNPIYIATMSNSNHKSRVYNYDYLQQMLLAWLYKGSNTFH